MNVNFGPLLKKTSEAIVENLPTWASRGAVVGVVSSVLLMHKADKKAQNIINQHTKHGGKLDNRSKIELTWKYYIPVVTSTGLTIGLIVASDKLWRNKYIAIAGAYEVTKRAYDDYRDIVREDVGEETENEIHKEATEKTVNNLGTRFDERFISRCGWGDSLFIESATGQIIIGNKESIKEVYNKLNYQMNNSYGEPDISIADLCSEFGLRYVSGASERGWNRNYTGLIEPAFNEVTLINGDADLPATVINYYQDPADNFGKDLFV